MRLDRWNAWHQWSSLACTAFLLLVCLTGLPLVFSDEIEHWLEPHAYARLPPDAPRADLDRLVATGRRMYPGEAVSSLFIDDEEPQVYLWMAPSLAALAADPRLQHFIRFDARTAEVLEASRPRGQRRGFMEVVRALHTDLFARLPGELFLGLMALLFVVSLVSGAVLYGPFMKKLDFGTVRAGRGRRLKWLDLHNLLGIATLAWACVVGATGLMNELATPLFALWQQTDVKAVLAPWQGRAAPSPAELGPAQAAYDTARRALPDMRITGITYPGEGERSPYHYLLWARGDTALTSRLFTPVLVDARSGALAAVVRMPWYLRALEVSRPLHFGDYGGLPLKMLWALLDLITIAVLGSGLYLWLARRRSHARRLRHLREGRP
ncbi:MAG: PepSY-associated TM helix domain-containing protein [Acidovorax sp.]